VPRIKLSVVFLPVFLYGFYLVVRFIAFENNSEFAAISFFQYVAPLAFFILGFYLWRVRQFQVISGVFAFATAFSLLLGLAYYFEGFGEALFENLKVEVTVSGGDLVRRVSSLAGYSLGTGFLAALGVLFSLRLPRWQRVPLMMLFSISLLNSYSRGALLMVLAGVSIWISLPVHQVKYSRSVRQVAVLLLVLVLLIVSYLIFSSVTPQLAGPFQDRFINNLINPEEEGNYARLFAWQWTLGIWQQNPLFGVGFGRLGSTVAAADTSSLAPESMYLKILGELGVLGLLFYLLAVAVPLTRSVKQVYREQTGDRKLAGILIGSVVAVLLGGIVLQNIESDFFALLFWLFLGGLGAYGEPVQADESASGRWEAFMARLRARYG
jgi:O-antigen ligase